jgi:Homeodomain-like domain
MRQTELRLSNRDRKALAQYRNKGLWHAREVNRAHVLAALDEKVPESMICRVLGVGRTVVWRTRQAYLEGGLEYAVHDVQRPGAPRRYQTNVEAEISALACSAPPAGAKRWTLLLLEREARTRPGMKHISRETIRRLLKKTASSPGGN